MGCYKLPDKKTYKSNHINVSGSTEACIHNLNILNIFTIYSVCVIFYFANI